MSGAAGEFLSNVGDLDAGTLGAIYLAVFIGGITFTGSIVAFSKLSGMMSSKALAFPVSTRHTSDIMMWLTLS